MTAEEEIAEEETAEEDELTEDDEQGDLLHLSNKCSSLLNIRIPSCFSP